MNRRKFLTWILGTMGAMGLGHLFFKTSGQDVPVSILSIPTPEKDFFQDIARIMSEDNLNLKGKSVLLKPNFVEYHPGRPINTDIRVIRQVAEACLFLGASRVSIGEAAGHRRDPWFSVQNPKIRSEINPRVPCLDLNHGNLRKIPNRGYYTGLPHFQIAAPLLESDIVISLPKLKTHHWVGVTLAMKNLFGTLPGIVYGWPKNLLHIKGIENSIVDLALTIPIHYAIIDGIIGMEGDGPILGTEKPVGALIMGRDLLGVDSTAARIMGFDPYKIRYMTQAAYHLPGIDEATHAYRAEHPKKFATKFACLPQLVHRTGGPFWP